MKSWSPLMTLTMLAIFVLMVGVAFTYPSAAGFMPLTVGIPGIALCLLQLGLDWYRRRTVGPAEPADPLHHAQLQVSRIAGRSVHFEMPSENALLHEEAGELREKLRREVAVWGCFLALIAGILLLGFRATIPVFLIAFLRFQAGASWRNALIYGGIGAFVMYIVFEKGLRVSLHSGFLTDYVLSLFN